MSWVKWIETKDVVTARPDETVADAVQRMDERRIGAVLVMDGDELKGIFTERDALRRVMASPDRKAATTPVGEVATPDPKVVLEETPIEDCARLVRDYGFRHVPVVDAQGVPVGIISSRDFLRFVVGELETLISRAYTAQSCAELSDPYASLAAGNYD